MRIGSIIMVLAATAMVTGSGAYASNGNSSAKDFVPARSPDIPVRKWGIDKRHPDPVVRDPNLVSLIIIGDSTVKNMDKGKAGWGDHIASLFDTGRINIVNWALGGRSSRSFIEEGRWDAALAQTKKGDFILLQLGHNDSKVLGDRGTIKGIGDETQDVAQKDSNSVVTVHSYGWYLRQYVADARAKGATIIFCTPVPRNSFDDSGRMRGSLGDYSGWMKEIARQENVLLLDLNAIVIKHYNDIGREKVGAELFAQKDGTHTSLEGAEANASYVVEGLKGLKDLELNKYLKAD